MTKYIGIAVAALMAMLTLSVFATSAFAEPIRDSYLCYKISDYKDTVKGGYYDNAECTIRGGDGVLEGEYELAELLKKTLENLWCALIMHENENGYYQKKNCTEPNTSQNNGDWTEVIKGFGSEGLIFEFAVETKFEASWGASKLNVAGAEIECKKAVTDEPEAINKKLGKILLDFKECSLGGKSCKSKTDEAGKILVPAEWHLVPPLGRIVFLIKATTIECEFLSTKVEIVEGSSVIGKIGQWGKKGKTFEVEVNAPEKAQEYTEYENDAGEVVKAELKVSVNGGKAKAATQEDEKATITTEKETELVS